MVGRKEPLKLYKQAIWLYVILLIFEGALRKWILPGLATPLLLIREPIVIWLVIVGVNRGWLKNNFVIAISIISCVSFLLSISVGHQNLSVALYGLRIYLFHIPFVFVVGRVISRKDLLKIGRFILYVSVPMTLLITLQFYAPQSAWVNRGVGGDTEGAGFSGALEYFRPSGTFSFTSGYVMYQLLVACFLFYYVISNTLLPQRLRIQNWLLWLILGCFLITIPFSISRTHFFQTIIVLGFMLLAVVLGRSKTIQRSLTKFVPALVAVLILLIFSGIMADSLGAFTTRLESANSIEGGVEGVVGNRYIGGLVQGLYNEQAPFWGYGLGLGTSVGAQLAGGNAGMFSFFNGEQEWNRMTNESGLLLGWAIIAVRLLISGYLFFRAYHVLRQQQDPLPWMLSAGVLLTFPQGQMGIPTNLGFIILLAGLGLAALKTKYNRKRL